MGFSNETHVGKADVVVLVTDEKTRLSVYALTKRFREQGKSVNIEWPNHDLAIIRVRVTEPDPLTCLW